MQLEELFIIKKNNVLSCDSALTGVLKLFENIDDYMILSHSVLCSPICPCNMSVDVRDDYYRGFFFSDLFSHFDLKTTEAGSNIDGCADGILQTIQNLYESNPNNTKGVHITNYKEFNKYWKKIEKKYKCSGWCRTKFNNPFTMYNDTMGKYVFSDISRGIPVLLEGPSGTSKTFSAEIICDLLGKKKIRFNLSSETTISDLLGRYIVNNESWAGIKMKEGPF